MFEVESAVFLLIDGDAKTRRLHEGKVIAAGEAEFTAAFEKPIDLKPGGDFIGLANANAHFFQQSLHVLAIIQAEPTLIVSFARVGEVISAEKRQMFRVSTEDGGVEVRIDRDRKCPMIDLGFEGFGAITKTEFRVGTFVQVTATQNGKPAFVARARVQSVGQRPDGLFRCGFYIPDASCPARKIMQQLCGYFQRLQLRRLADAA